MLRLAPASPTFALAIEIPLSGRQRRPARARPDARGADGARGAGLLRGRGRWRRRAAQKRVTPVPAVARSGVQHAVGERAADTDKAPALLQLVVVEGEGEILVHLAL